MVVSGEIEGLNSQAYRAFPSPAGRESTFICTDADADHPRVPPPSVRRYASVAAGSLGWLLAVNPLDDRAITPADIERLQYVGSLIVDPAFQRQDLRRSQGAALRDHPRA